jgi:hypothetical protein
MAPKLASPFPRMSADDDPIFELLRAYVGIHADEGTPEYEDHQVAFGEVSTWAQHEPERCWKFLEVTCAADLTDANMAFIAAGPLEDLLGHHGEVFLPRVEAAARQSARMRLLVAMDWKGLMSRNVWRRFNAMRARLGIDPL